MRALIIGNGDIKNYDNIMRKIGRTDLIICADGGYNHAKKMGITPDVLIGDLDSAIGYEEIKNRVEYLLRNRLRINGKCGQTLSIIPVTADVRGISTSGLEYPLDNETLYFSSTRGISNVMTADTCEITIKEGLALVVKVDRV